MRSRARALAARVEAAPAIEKKTKITRRNIFKAGGCDSARRRSGGARLSCGAKRRSRRAWRRRREPRASHERRDSRPCAAAADHPRIDRFQSGFGGRNLGKWVDRACQPSSAAESMRSTSTPIGCWPRSGIGTTADFNPIAHHLCAFPSADPYNSFRIHQQHAGRQEFADLRHPHQYHGARSRLQHLPRPLRRRADAVDGKRIRGDWPCLGVHVTINPKDAQSYFVTDGQKDIAACFDRTSLAGQSGAEVRLEVEFERVGARLSDGGVLKISKIYPDSASGKYDYLGTKGQKIDWEMVPMGELFVEEGTLPGDDPMGPHRRRWNDLASDRAMGRHRRSPLRRDSHPRRREQLRPGRIPPVQRQFARSVPSREGRRRSLGGDLRQDPFAGARESAFRRTAASSA